MDVQWQLKNIKAFDRETMGEIYLIRKRIVRFGSRRCQILGWRNGERFRLREMGGLVPKYQNSNRRREKICKVLKTKLETKGATASGGRKLAKSREYQICLYKARKTW